MFSNVTVVKNNTTNATIGCSFLNNLPAYCVLCCATRLDDLLLTQYLNVGNISATIGTEVTVDLDGLTSGQTYYCKVAAAYETTTIDCSKNSVVYGFDVFFSFDTPMDVPLPTTTISPTSKFISAIVSTHKSCHYVPLSQLAIIRHHGICLNLCQCQNRYDIISVSVPQA